MIDPISFEYIRTQFTPREWFVIHRLPEPAKEFTRFWTTKESLIKADCRRLGSPLLDLDVLRLQPIRLDNTVRILYHQRYSLAMQPHLCTEDIAADFVFRELQPVTISASS